MEIFDLRNAIVALGLLDIRRRFKAMRVGESMAVLWGEATVGEDLMRVLPEASFDVVSLGEIPGQPPGFRLELVKTRGEPEPLRGSAIESPPADIKGGLDGRGHQGRLCPTHRRPGG
jgi:hypothetical protein